MDENRILGLIDPIHHGFIVMEQYFGGSWGGGVLKGCPRVLVLGKMGKVSGP